MQCAAVKFTKWSRYGSSVRLYKREQRKNEFRVVIVVFVVRLAFLQFFRDAWKWADSHRCGGNSSINTSYDVLEVIFPTYYVFYTVTCCNKTLFMTWLAPARVNVIQAKGYMDRKGHRC